MALTISDTANFTARTTEGKIDFHDWIGDGSAVRLDPRDFTPVCTTELGYIASMEPDFDRRNIKIVGSRPIPSTTTGVGPGHRARAGYRAELSDDRRQRSRDREGVGCCRARSWAIRAATPRPEPDPAQRLRRRPGQEDQARPDLSDVHRAQLDEVLHVIDSLQLTRRDQVATPAQWQPGDNAIIGGLGQRGSGEGALPRRVGPAATVHAHRPRAVVVARPASLARGRLRTAGIEGAGSAATRTSRRVRLAIASSTRRTPAVLRFDLAMRR